MRQTTISKLSGLQVLQNSLTVNPGFFERADNVTILQDFIVTSRRGVRGHARLPAGQTINALFSYGDSAFSITQDTLYRIRTAAVTAQAVATVGSTAIVVRRAAHGLRDGDYIADFVLTNSDAFVAAFPKRQSNFYGSNQVTVQFLQAAARAGNEVTVTQTAHGLQTGDTINVTASTLGTAVGLGVKTITVLTANTFKFSDTGPAQAGTVTFQTLDAFRITATEPATATVSSGAAAASFRFYTVQGGQSIVVTDAGVRTSRALRSNQNLYFTSDNGVLKLERADLPVLKAGIPPGLDLQGVLGKSPTGVNTGPIEADRQVAYKILFGRKDANGNTNLGEPSEALVLRNALTSIATAAINDSALPVVTVTLVAHGLTTGETIFVSSAATTPAGKIPDRQAFIVTVTGVDTFNFNLSSVNITGVTDVASFSFGVRKSAALTFSIPSEIASSEFLYQVFRTTQSVSSTTLPEENYRLLEEANLTAAQLAQGFVDFTDEIDQILVQSGSQLYTNPTVEGPLQENARPPRAQDAVLFKNYVFYANTTGYRSMELAIVAPSLIANNDHVTLGGSGYVFKGNAANEPVGNERTTASATTSGYVEITRTNHGFTVGDTIRVVSATGLGGVAAGTYSVSVVPTANTFRFGTGASGTGTVTFEGVSDISGRRLVKLYVSNANVTFSEAVAFTARGFVKAVNRNAASVLYARYTSAPNATPGKMFFEAKNLNAATFSAIVSNAAATQAFLPDLPTTGTTVSDSQDRAPNELSVAKVSEPEAVPRTNKFPAGSKSAAILRILPLRDSLIILKEDGVFRLNGDTISNFSITALDTTVLCVATNSVVVLNNSVMAFSNQGVVQITDSSVRIVSREIEPLLTAVLGNPNIESLTSAVGYESERVYMLSTIRPNSKSATPDVIYVFNYLTNAWTTHSGADVLFLAGLVVESDDKLLLTQASARHMVNKERKDQTKVDFSGQEWCVPILVGTIASATAEAGSTQLVVSTIEDHGFAPGQLITLAQADSTLFTAFPSGAADVNGLRVVSTVLTPRLFTVQASAAATGSSAGTLTYVEFMSEASVVAQTTAGSPTVTITTSQPHGLVTGKSITVHSLGTAVGAAFALGSHLTGYRSVNVLSPTQFTVTATNAPTGTATGPVVISDKRQGRLQVTAITPTTFQPQVGDAIVTGNSIYTVTALTQFSTTAYVLKLRFRYKQLSTDLSFVHVGYKNSLRFAPLTFGDPGKLKYFSEFSATFRNSSSCTKMNVNFSTDAFVSVDGNAWDFAVGSNKQPFLFGGWGSLPWGQFPWGGGTSIQREFTTRPAVLLRMYVPKDAFVGVFLQPILEHRVAGEPLELQSISVFHQPVTQRVSK
jgi:hypothetical protein